MSDKTYDRGLEIFTAASEAEDLGDNDKAIRLYRLAARLGFSPALINLGNWYDDKAIPRAPKEAVKLYKRAVSLGDEVAAYSLAIHYRNLKNKRWYLYWLKRSAQMGYEEAVIELTCPTRV
jgi:TPR repeat protein